MVPDNPTNKCFAGFCTDTRTILSCTVGLVLQCIFDFSVEAVIPSSSPTPCRLNIPPGPQAFGRCSCVNSDSIPEAHTPHCRLTNALMLSCLLYHDSVCGVAANVAAPLRS